jgi:hypothetical protein
LPGLTRLDASGASENEEGRQAVSRPEDEAGREAGCRLEVHLDRIGHNARELVGRLGRRGITVTGITKATLGSPEVARELVHAGTTKLIKPMTLKSQQKLMWAPEARNEPRSGPKEYTRTRLLQKQQRRM